MTVSSVVTMNSRMGSNIHFRIGCLLVFLANSIARAHDLEDELCIIELEMIVEAMERAEKRKTDYTRLGCTRSLLYLCLYKSQ